MLAESKPNREVRSEEELTRELFQDYPCGILRCTYEEYPKAIYANDRMLRFLGTWEESEDWRGLISQNIFFMLPFEERVIFRDFLETARHSREPVPIEHRIIHCAGGTGHLVGWVRVAPGENGLLEYQFMYMQIARTWVSSRRKRESAYRQVLQGAYDMVFELDYQENTLACIHKKEEIQLWFISAARFLVTDIVKESFFKRIHPEDQAEVRNYVQRVLDRDDELERGLPIRFRTMRGEEVREYFMVSSRLDDRSALLCGRDVTQENYTERVEAELADLRSIHTWMTELGENTNVRRINFRVTEKRVYPLSTKSVVCRHCDISEEEYGWAQRMGLSIEDFLARCHISISDLQAAFREGECLLPGQLEYPGQERRLYITRRAVRPGMGEEHTLCLCISDEVKPAPTVVEKPRVRIRTFGYFDVFVDDQPVAFRYEKSKEMLAVLVDRAGGYASNPYIISCLWENEPYSERLQGRCRQTAHRLMEILRQYGIEDIIEKVDGRRRIIPEKVDCDYYNYMNGKRLPGQQFSGTYMSDYSWGEITLSSLQKEQEGSVT